MPIDLGTLSAALGVTAVLATAASALATTLISRRSASGRVGTSEASVLWQQAQEMRAMLLAEKTKAEDQRDKLIAAYTGELLPTLASVNTLAHELTAAVAANMQSIRSIDSTLTAAVAANVRSIQSIEATLTAIETTLTARDGEHAPSPPPAPHPPDQAPARRGA